MNPSYQLFREGIIMKDSYIFQAYILMITIFSSFFIFAGYSFGDDLQKLDPQLKSFLLNNGRINLAPFNDQGRFPSDKSNPMLNTMIKINGNPNILASVGVRVRSAGKNIVTADVPAKSLSKLIALPNVVYVQSLTLAYQK
jgi:hypothetical protein